MFLTLLMLVAPAVPAAAAPAPVSAVLGERNSEFATLAQCNDAIGYRSDNAPSGSVYNRRQGNVTRCEMVDGVPYVIVYPRGYRPPAAR